LSLATLTFGEGFRFLMTLILHNEKFVDLKCSGVDSRKTVVDIGRIFVDIRSFAVDTGAIYVDDGGMEVDIGRIYVDTGKTSVDNYLIIVNIKPIFCDKKELFVL
jgi:hypothetical protein